ncbi:ABC transporter substrate-binding protein [Microbacterium betulae]|uniref:ABC transporter substrate-binding protein n=1 Tax=Microbacterium betulae TaxID=2981139 RepID=A0AA97I5G5_9MICO|nr:ABC transporter substrate-binding protein [Microbacterium sp. AB]WOF22784.1 ABC transporter substrate-binding protein [Microbacterium sp. AB]
MKTRSRLALGAVAALALLLSACSGGDAGTDQATSAEPQSGGELTVGITDWCGAYDKQQTSGCTYSNIQITDNLVDQDPATGEIVPWLATDWTISDDGLRYEFALRDDVTFSNGEAFDAETVKLNLDAIIELGKQGNAFQSSAYLEGYTGAEVVDEHTVAVTFDAPKAGFLQALSEAPLGIVAPETTKLTAEERFEGVIGSGPFVLDEIVQDEKVVLTKREDYAWGSTVRGNEGAAYLDEITFLVIPEAATRIGSLTSGQVDAITYPTTNDIAEVEGSATVYSAASSGVVYTLYPNDAHPLLSQPAVRQAIQKAIDREEIDDVILDDTKDAATSIVSSVFPGYVDLSDELAYDEDAVAGILTGDGWELGDDGVYAKDGERLSVDLQYTTSENQALFELIQQQLAANGIELELRQLTEAEETANRESGDWGLSFGNLTRPDPDVFLSSFTSEYATRVTVDPDPELHDAIFAQSTELDADRRQELNGLIQRTIVEEGIGFPIHEATSVVATKPTVHGVGFTAPWWAIFGAAWVEQ